LSQVLTKLREPIRFSTGLPQELPLLDLCLWVDSTGLIRNSRLGTDPSLARLPRELVGRPLGELSGGGARSAASADFNLARSRAISEQRIQFVDFAVPSSDGEDEAHFEARISPMPGREVFVVVRDDSHRKLREKRLRDRGESYRSVFESAATAVLIVHPKTEEVLSANARALELYGYEAHDFVGRSLRSLSCNARSEPQLHLRMRGDLRPEFETVHLHRSGRQLLLEIQASPVRYAGDWAVLTIHRDITERERVRNELESSLSLLKATLEATPDGIVVADGRGGLVMWNSAFQRIWDLPMDALEGRNESKIIAHIRRQLTHPDRFVSRVRELYTSKEGDSEDVIACTDGRVFETRSCPQRVGGRTIGRVWSFRDVTAQRKIENTIRHQAYHDSLTTLPNRLLFKDRLEQAVGQAKRTEQLMAILFIDLDRFKSINDTMGHSAGDELLRQVASRLLARKREGDTVSRLGGDEFMVMINNLRSVDDVPTVALGILESLRAPFDIEGRSLRISASMGVSLYPRDGADPEELIQNADSALYKSKDEGRDTYSLYEPALNTDSLAKLALENDLRDALTKSEFVLHFQPQVGHDGGRIEAAEALVRWRRDDGTLTSPSKFIPVAEDCGMIDGIGSWVLREACRRGTEWQTDSSPITLAVNVSAHQFQRVDFVDEVAGILDETGFAAENLELELTERTIMHNPERGVATLTKLREMGIQIAVDDFGAGHASLSQLRMLPLTTLKIDQAFVRHCDTHASDGAIVNAIVTMAHSLGLRVVAEGVETSGQAEFLRERDCDMQQGFYFSRPVTAERMAELLRAGQNLRPTNDQTSDPIDSASG